MPGGPPAHWIDMLLPCPYYAVNSLQGAPMAAYG